MSEHRPNHHWLGQWGGGEYAVHYLAGAINGLAKVCLEETREGERSCSGEQQRANWGEGELAL